MDDNDLGLKKKFTPKYFLFQFENPWSISFNRLEQSCKQFNYLHCQ